jgi:hypothetical protein
MPYQKIDIMTELDKTLVGKKSKTYPDVVLAVITAALEAKRKS